ncbi:MAG: bifunctional oligoribonuclease/PAP phosphatase NrnA [Clostridiales bacterium]|nr:bifunctional oligoribonuclease/PAP phosphatase NrnA [Clostridiales bacterium]
MTALTDNNSVDCGKTDTDKIIDAINSAKTVLVCGHVRPDGDCVSSALAMKALCEKLGKQVDAVCDLDNDKPDNLSHLRGFEQFGTASLEYYDLFIAVDCATAKRLGRFKQYLDDAAFSVNIDHHPTNERYGKINHIEPDASSTCAIIFGLFEQSGLIDKDIATALYTGLSTDTGHFMHSNTDSKVFGIAEKLTEYGLDVGSINNSLYCSKSYSRVKLTARVLDSIKLYGDGEIALMTITQKDLKSCGCKSDDTEGLIDYASSIRGVKIAIAICEQVGGGQFRVSLRSKSADVAAVAQTFGGGGHKLAAGCIIFGAKDFVEKKIVEAATAALK